MIFLVVKGRDEKRIIQCISKPSKAMQISFNKYLFSSYYMQDRDDQCVQVKGQILMPESWVLATALPLICCMNLGKLLVLSGPKFPHWYNVGVRLGILTMTYSSHGL